jgi:hypothetical protein
MMYTANVAVLRSVQNTQRKASTMQNIWMLNLVVSTETARLYKVNKGKNKWKMPNFCHIY